MSTTNQFVMSLFSEMETRGVSLDEAERLIAENPNIVAHGILFGSRGIQATASALMETTTEQQPTPNERTR